MSQQFFTIVTNIGQQRIARAAAVGTQVSLSHMAVGDGNGRAVTPEAGMTALKREVFRAQVNTLNIDPKNRNQIIAELVIPEEVGDFTIREVGLFDSDRNLIAVGNLPEAYKPRAASGTASQQVVRMIIQVSSPAAVAIKIDPAIVLATREYVDQNKTEVVNNLTTNKTDAALSVAMGKKLNEDKLNKTDLKFYRAPVLAGSQAVTLDLTNRQSIIDNFGDKYIVFGHLQMVLHNSENNHHITGLPLNGQKGAVQLDFYLMGGFSYVDCHYVALNRTFRTSVNWNNETLQLRWKENLNEDNGLRSHGNQTLLNGRFTVQTENNSWAQIAAKSAGDGWIFEVGPEGEGQFTHRRKDAFATHTGNIAIYKLPAGGTGTHVLATESQIVFVKPGIKPATSEIIDLTKKSEILAYAGTSGNKHIQLTFYNNASSQIVGLPIEDKSPCQMDISIMGAYTVCRVYYFYLRREFVSSVNWNNEELSYRWDETVNKNTAVMLDGNQDVGGNKKFLGRTEFAGGVKITNDTRSVEVGVGSSDVYIGNITTRKFLQLKDTGSLEYSNQKIYHEGNKPAWNDIQNKPDVATRGTTLAHYGITDSVTAADFQWANVKPGTVMYFAGEHAPHGWLAANGAAVSRTGFPHLFAAIGTRYGAGDGRNTFNIPDLRGEFVRGWDAGRGVNAGRALGSFEGQSTENHWHGIGNVPSGNDDAMFIERGWSVGYNGNMRHIYGEVNREVRSTVSSGNLATGDAIGHAGETRPRNIALLACIKA